MIWIAVVITIYYVGLAYWLTTSTDAVKADQAPNDVTVVIPVKNGVEYLAQCLDAVITNASTYREVIVVNDGAAEDLDQLVQTYLGMRVRVIQNSGQGKKMAIQTAVNQIATEWVSVIDVDVQVKSNWLSTMLSYAQPATHMVLGPVFIGPSGGLLAQFQSVEFLALQTATHGSANRNVPISANGANMLFKRNTFIQVNPYQGNTQRNTGDDVFLLNAIVAKYDNAVVYASSKDAVVITQPVPSVEKMLKQRKRWASKADVVHGINQKVIGAIVVLTNLFMAFLYVKSAVHGIGYLWIWIVFKWLADYRMMEYSGKLAEQTIPIPAFILSSIGYPFVVIYSVVAGLFAKTQTASA